LVFPSVATETPKKLRPLIPPEVIERIKNADAIMIRAGAGMSVDAVHKELGLGLDYTSPTVFSTLYPGLVKSSNMRCLYDTVRCSSFTVDASSNSLFFSIVWQPFS
jgi:hypothetical protein